MIGIFTRSSFLMHDIASALKKKGLSSHGLLYPVCARGGLLSKAQHISQEDMLYRFIDQHRIHKLYIDGHLAITFFSVLHKMKINSVGLIGAGDADLADELLRKGMYTFLFLPFYDNEIG